MDEQIFTIVIGFVFLILGSIVIIFNKYYSRYFQFLNNLFIKLFSNERIPKKVIPAYKIYLRVYSIVVGILFVIIGLAFIRII